MATINIAAITQEAKTYQKELRLLPYYILAPELSRLGIQLMQVAGTDIITQAQRKGGLLKPYDAANIDYSSELMKFREAELTMKTSVISFKDSIKNYTGKKFMNNPIPGTSQNQTKKHPFENLITSNVVTTCAEDILEGLWPAEYDITDRSPLGCFDGYDTQIDALISSGDIAAGNGNYTTPGTFAAPAGGDTNAIDYMIIFVRAADRFLQRFGLLYVSRTLYGYLVDALENKFQYKDWDINGVQRYINEKCGSNITLIPNEFMGTGTRVMLTVPGNLHFGMDTFGDETFVDVRTPYEDPNLMQFWLQADFGCRICSIHKKEFLINDGTAVQADLSGDYHS